MERPKLTDQQVEWLDGLHAAYVFFCEHPEVIPTHGGLSIKDYSSRPTERERAAMWARALGHADKRPSGAGTDLFYIEAKPGRFGPHTVGYTANRDAVCTKTVTTVEEEVTEPDPEAVAALPMVTRTVTREIVEWDCSEPLLAVDEAVAS